MSRRTLPRLHAVAVSLAFLGSLTFAGMAPPATALQPGLDRFCAEAKVHAELNNKLRAAWDNKATADLKSLTVALQASDVKLVAMAPAEVAKPLQDLARSHFQLTSALAGAQYQPQNVPVPTLIRLNNDSTGRTGRFRYLRFVRGACGVTVAVER